MELGLAGRTADILVLDGGGPPSGSAQVVSEESIQQSVSLLLKPMVAAVNGGLSRSL